MMTYKEARALRQGHDADVSKLNRTRKTELVAIRRAELAAEGIEQISGGPVSKDELISDILNRRYPIASMNESIHVLYHAPSARWPACEHCQAAPQTETVNTSQLRPGDVVVERGMRIRVDDIRTYHGGMELEYHCAGTVLNADDVRANGHVPASFMEAYDYDDAAAMWIKTREDAWTITGSRIISWLVELPRPAAPVDEGWTAEA